MIFSIQKKEKDPGERVFGRTKSIQLSTDFLSKIKCIEWPLYALTDNDYN